MDSQDKTLRQLLWLYFFLVIFEGALRKWVLPGLATPLLIARDPVCVAAILLGHHHLIRSPLALGFIGFGIIGTIMAVVFGHGNIPVTVFGARIWILHFPMIFLFAAVFTREDVWKFARVTLLISIPMTVLLGMQFYAPQSHILNVGIAGEGSSGFIGAAGRFRCSGTFSFTNGLTTFYGMAAALFAGYLAAGPRPIPKWFWIAGGGLAIAVPLAISRHMAFSYALTGLCAIAAAGISPRLLRTLIPAAIALTVVVSIAAQTQVFDDATEAFSQRWQAATMSESGGEGVRGVIQNRVVNYDLLNSFNGLSDIPLFGLGIGLGTNVGAKLMTGGRGFTVSETAWGNMIGEFGPIIGLLLISYRTAITTFWALSAFLAVRSGNPLPLILGSVAFVSMFMGTSAQPTALGFLVTICGLFLAAIRQEMSEEEAPKENESKKTNNVSSLYA